MAKGSHSKDSTRKKSIHLFVTNDLSGDQRMHRICLTLHEAGYEVHLIGRSLPHSPELEQRPYHTHRFHLPVNRGMWFYLVYNLALIGWLLKRRPDLIVSNDLDTLLGCFLGSKLRQRVLVYDSHEYFTEVPELIHRPRVRAVWLRIERWILPRIKYCYTVNESLARIYRTLYGIPMQVIRNVPIPKPLPPSPSPSEEKILIYQGALNIGRGLELMVDAMSYLPEHCSLWIIGRGDVEATLRTQISKSSAASRIKMWGFMKPQELAKVTPQAHLGLSIEEDLGGNYHYASPNKVYDYIQAHIPVLVSDLPEMRHTVETYEVGWVLEEKERTPERLAYRIRSIFSEQKQSEYEHRKNACHKAAELLNWEAEKQSLLAIYVQALGLETSLIANREE